MGGNTFFYNALCKMWFFGRSDDEFESDQEVVQQTKRAKAETVAEKETNDVATSTVREYQEIFRQFDCPICYETMASTCVITPCGCSFCYVCIETWYCDCNKNECPSCKQVFDLKNAVLNKRTDCVIREFLKTNKASKEEMAKWEQRVQVGIQHKNAFGKPRVVVAPPVQAPAQLLPAWNRIIVHAEQVVTFAAMPENAINAGMQARAHRAQNFIQHASEIVDLTEEDDSDN